MYFGKLRAMFKNPIIFCPRCSDLGEMWHAISQITYCLEIKTIWMAERYTNRTHMKSESYVYSFQLGNKPYIHPTTHIIHVYLLM